MKYVSLLEVLRAQKSDKVVLACEFRAIADLSDPKLGEHGGGYGQFTAVIVKAVLERTAVVYPLAHVEDTRVVRLDHIVVEEDQLRWVPRNPRELRQLRARMVGRQRGRLSKGPPV